MLYTGKSFQMTERPDTSFDAPFDDDLSPALEPEDSFSLEEFETDYEVSRDEDLAETFRTECDSFFAPGGLLETQAAAEKMKCELRPQQRTMANAIADALCTGSHLCVEAPTGVGKSFAYLVPLVYRAQRQCRPAVISTETINLQEQLINKDIPLLSKLMGVEIKASIAKGRRNYLCRRRFAMLTGEQRDMLLPNPSLALDIERLTKHLEKGAGGTRDDFAFRIDSEVWNLICCESGNCMKNKCPHFRNCCYFKAKRQWENSDIIVANHALFFTDLAMRCAEGAAGALLPNYGAVLFDEAHSLEDSAASHLGVRLSRPLIVSTLNRIYNPDNAKGLLMRKNAPPELRGFAADARNESYGFFAAFEELLDRQNESALEITHPENFIDTLTPKLMRLASGLQQLADDEEEEDASFKTEIDAMISRCREAVDDLDAFMHRTMPQAVYYAEDEPGGVSLNVTPLDIADILAQLLFNQDFTVILCSATLTVRNRFDYFISRTGFSGRILQLDSPFSPDQAVIRLVRDMPDPKSGDYKEALADEIFSAVELTEGKAFVLFTSYEMLRYCKENLYQDFWDHKWLLLAQGNGSSRSQLLRDFKEDVNSVLFGTDSFWTGVDVPGEALSHVIITKLPFAVPSHPLIAARMRKIEQEGGNSFSGYSLPEAVLKFRQGAGRLIRNREDRGYITVLDPRMITRNYGRMFLESLPYRNEII